MHATPLFRSARLCYLAGRPYWVRPLDLDGWGTLFGWLDDVLEGQDDRKGYPPFGSAEAQAALSSDAGLALLAWLGLRGSGVDYEGAVRLVLAAEDAEKTRFVLV